MNPNSLKIKLSKFEIYNRSCLSNDKRRLSDNYTLISKNKQNPEDFVAIFKDYISNIENLSQIYFY